MSDMSLGMKLQRMGAGFAGNLPQFDAARAQQDDLRFKREERNRALSVERLKAMAQDAQTAQKFLDMGEVGKTLELLDNRIQFINQYGGDPSDTQEFRDLVASGDIDAAKRELNLFTTQAQINGLIEPLPGQMEGPAKVQSSTMLPGGLVQLVMSDGSVKTVTPSEAEQLQIRQAEERGNELARKREAGKAEGRGLATGSTDRLNQSINEGLGAVKGIPVLRRAITLLEDVETSGYENAKLAAKQFFGVDSADEAELSSNLGRAVLGQLRETFGAQFTEREGERLDRLSARFGRSTEGNRRILQQTLKIATDAAERGLDASIRAKDFGTAKDIQDFLDGSYDLTDESLTSIFNPQPRPGTDDEGDGWEIVRP